MCWSVYPPCVCLCIYHVSVSAFIVCPLLFMHRVCLCIKPAYVSRIHRVCLPIHTGVCSNLIMRNPSQNNILLGILPLPSSLCIRSPTTLSTPRIQTPSSPSPSLPQVLLLSTPLTPIPSSNTHLSLPPSPFLPLSLPYPYFCLSSSYRSSHSLPFRFPPPSISYPNQSLPPYPLTRAGGRARCTWPGHLDEFLPGVPQWVPAPCLRRAAAVKPWKKVVRSR